MRALLTLPKRCADWLLQRVALGIIWLWRGR